MKAKSVIQLLLVLLLAMWAQSAEAARGPGFQPSAEHPPSCFIVPHIVPGTFELNCLDTGKDIVDVQISYGGKYDLLWNNEVVILKVYYDVKDRLTGGNESISWMVCDKQGNMVHGAYVFP